MGNIRTRLTVQFMGLVTVVLLLFSLGVYGFSRLYLEKRFFSRLQDRALSVTAQLFEPANSPVRRKPATTDPLPAELVSVYNETLHRTIFSADTGRTGLHEPFIGQLKPGRPRLYLRQGDRQLLAISLTGAARGNWILVSAVDQQGQAALTDLRQILGVMGLAGGLLLSLAGWLFAGRALAPMDDIVGQVNAIFPANMTRRVAHDNPDDEIGTLVATVNRLLDRVGEALLNQKLLIANVSHELKNPLTKIRSQLDVALRQPRDPDTYARLLTSLRDDTIALTDLTNTLLTLAGTDAESLPMQPVRLDELLWGVKEQVEKWNELYRVSITFADFPDEEESLLVMGNEAALKNLLLNLIDNACKFADDNQALVLFRADGDTITVQVANSGPTIPPADLPHIFEPFYRSRLTAATHRGMGWGSRLPPASPTCTGERSPPNRMIRALRLRSYCPYWPDFKPDLRSV
ncbi:ATP-binding protein [Spirosoma rhododendri]